MSLVRFHFRSDYYADHDVLRLPLTEVFKTFKQFKVQSAHRDLEIFVTAISEQPSCQFPNEWTCGDQKVCIIGEIRNYVASMLRAQKINGSPLGP